MNLKKIRNSIYILHTSLLDKQSLTNLNHIKTQFSQNVGLWFLFLVTMVFWLFDGPFKDFPDEPESYIGFNSCGSVTWRSLNDSDKEYCFRVEQR